MDEKAERPELFRSIRLLPKDVSLALLPEVAAWIEETEKRLQPIVDRALEAAVRDIVTYGATQQTPEQYVLEAVMRGGWD